MSTITLELPPEVEMNAREIASATAQPLEAVLLERLKSAFALPLLAPDEEAELAALHNLSDDTLWTIAREQMPAEIQTRMRELMEKMSRGTATTAEAQEQVTYVERGQRLMLRKSEAAAVLTQRGHQLSFPTSLT
jgi:uncharacterized protein YbcC (UPF0753/DUF2309 family)